MGCTGSKGMVTDVSKNCYQQKFKFEVRAYNGAETDGTKEMMEYENQANEGKTLEDKVITMDNYAAKRAEIEGQLDEMLEMAKEMVDAMLEKLTKTEEKVKMRDGVEISMFVYKPKALESQDAPCYFYAHGGGAWSLAARHVEANMMQTALNLNCVIFNIDYRLAPEHKCPGGQQDYVDCMKYVFANAAKFGIKPEKTVMAGCSGGGYIAVGAANLLAKENQLGMVKALFIHTGMLSNATQHLPQEKLEKYDTDYMGEPEVTTSYFKLLATDWDNQQNDDQLFPGRVSDEILKKYPPTVVWTSEFDFLRRDNEIFADRLKALGKLVDISKMPGTVHCYHQMGSPEDCQEIKWFCEEEKLAFDKLVC